MEQLNFAEAHHYALQCLSQELSTTLHYHSVAHTRDVVVLAVERLATMEGVEGEAFLLLQTAAWYHDLGFVEQHTDHESISIRIAAATLPRFGYCPEQITVIAGMIMATKMPQSPHTLLEAILADADLDVLGREDFLHWSQALRAKLAEYGAPMTDEQWFQYQLQFFQDHCYFTTAARALRDDRKQRNFEMLSRWLAQCQDHD
jgi:uncharacterized protein